MFLDMTFLLVPFFRGISVSVSEHVLVSVKWAPFSLRVVAYAVRDVLWFCVA